jgi:hypothetical protein
MAWLAFFISLPLRLYTNWVVLAALAIGLVKRHGMPKFNKAYVQKMVFDENLQMLPYIGVVAVAGGQTMVLYMPLLIHGFLEVSPLFKEILDRNPSAPLISASFLKPHILNGVALRAQYQELEADTEVYLGIYLIAVFFIGWSSFLTIIMFWQIMRVRYMMSANSKAAFRRIDKKITGLTSHPRCPSIVGTLYLKLRGFLSSMADLEQ